MFYKTISNWKEFGFTRNDCTSAKTGKSVFSDEENKMLNELGAYVEDILSKYPNNKFKHFDVIQECLLASLRDFKKNNPDKTNEEYCDFVEFEIREKATKEFFNMWLAPVPGNKYASFATFVTTYPANYEVDRK
tara:strand:- start:424 stop:825 length:402 start_codon:yes stop_codon:yes gene_type:complete